ncbi:unnamed protein product [Danaus chrysippus]|uniref:(African queen) hypothetical protein n=1 Tax=Danaus chrysippus TaxID=151541 RepID=A0A8J2QVS2_9NEOP|nr:unnamed protein product [Danaus chrysippus]
MSGPQPSGAGRGNWKNLAPSQADEDAFDYVKFRDTVKPSGYIGSVANMVKGALGGGILGGHVAYMKAGIAVALPFNLIFGIYMTFCLHILVLSAQILYRRCRVTFMTYPDVGEAAMACFPHPKVARFSKIFRYTIDIIIGIDLYGSCACYQIIIAKSIKQLVENLDKDAPDDAGRDIRVYLAAMMIPVILICLIIHLKYLAPLSIVANLIICVCIFLTVYYALVNNPRFEGMKMFTEVYNFFEFTGMVVFSMSCSGVVIPIENNMEKPKNFPKVLLTGMSIIILFTFLVSFFGYSGYLEKCESPITVNFPMTLWAKLLKGGIAIMIYVTHALNFWVPFNLCFYYIKFLHNQNKLFMWELIYRAFFCFLVSIVAIIFPNINALMGFLGAFCLSNMAFIWPNLIYLMVIWQRPGLGKFRWRLWRAVILMSVGVFILICGTIVNFNELMSVFK